MPLCDTCYITFFGSGIPFLRSKFEFDPYWPLKIQYGGHDKVKYSVWGTYCVLTYISNTFVVLINYADYIISIEVNKTKNHRVEFLKGHLGRFGGRHKLQFSAKVRNSDLDSFDAIPMCDTCYIPFFRSRISFLISEF